ncbi:MAG: BrnA antitoxin family protein [Deltaproteobacteria bacterium]|nr:BrnA antitoxin family protein [Deltaproteobacteria bacterium]
MKKPKIARYSSDTLKKLRRFGKSGTNWSRVRSLQEGEENIDFSDSPEIPPDVFANSIIGRELSATRPRKFQLTLRIDEDVLKWFKSKGHGYQTRINSLLRAYKEAHR